MLCFDIHSQNTPTEPDNNIINIQMTLNFLDIKIDNLNELSRALNQFECDICSELNSFYGQPQFFTHHSTMHCLRCKVCHCWMKTPEGFAEHISRCHGFVCKFFETGYCRDGPSCQFLHVSPSGFTFPTKKQRNIFERDHCVFFQKGDCKKGDECPFKHGNEACKHCGGLSHDARHCAKCYRCREWGHVAVACTKNKDKL